MQQRQHGVVGARAEVRAQHRVQRERAFQERRLEDFLEDVEDVDAGDAQELAHVLAAEQADVEPEHRRADEVDARRRRAAAARGCAACDDVGEVQHPRAVVSSAARSPSETVPPTSLPPSSTRWSPSSHSATVRRLARASLSRATRAAGLGDVLVQQVQQVRAGGNRKPGANSRVTAAPPTCSAASSTSHLAARLRQVGRAHQAVVAAADDDDRRVPQSSVQPSGTGVGPAQVQQDLARRIGARRGHDAATRMGARSAHVQALRRDRDTAHSPGIGRLNISWSMVSSPWKILPSVRPTSSSSSCGVRTSTCSDQAP